MADIGQYEKLKVIGRGSFATIYKVKHKKLGFVRAIKESNEYITDEHDKAYQTFLKECAVLLRLGNGGHPNIVRIYEPRLIDNRATVEMDFIQGETLNDYLARVRFMPIDEVMRFTREIVGALAYCHVDIYKYLMSPETDELEPDPADATRYLISPEKERELVKKYGVTHNDLHSNNIMRRDVDGSFVLLDFGLSVQDGQAVKSSARNDGALEYLAPEKWEPGKYAQGIGPWTDVYSLGILLYEVLAGCVPFPLDPIAMASEQARHELYTHHMQDAPPAIEPLRKAAFEATHPGEVWTKDYPRWLEEIILKCLAKDPNDRYANAREVLDDIKQHKRDKKSVSLFKGKPFVDDNDVSVLVESPNNNYQVAKHSHAEAQFQLGLNYEKENKIEKAAECYRVAAEQGHAKAQYFLGISFYNGKGVDKNYAKAVNWFLRSAQQGHADAQYAIGVCDFFGHGVKKNYEAAALWFMLAAQQGHADAQYLYGYCLTNGYGLLRNVALANVWLEKSAEQGNNKAKKQVIINKRQIKKNNIINLIISILSILTTIGIIILVNAK